LWWILVVAVNVAKAERARFSHALTAEVKKIIRNLRGATISRRCDRPSYFQTPAALAKAQKNGMK